MNPLILNKNVKSLTIPALYFIETRGPDGKLRRDWYTCELGFRIWNEEDFQDDFLYLMYGRTGHFFGKVPERRLMLFYKHLETCEGIDLHSKRTGLTITRSESKPVKEGLLELYNSNKYVIAQEDEFGNLVFPQLTTD